MINVKRKSPPADFDTKVKIPGNAFLATNPNPTNKQFKQHRYWSNALDDLYLAYEGICAYSASWIAREQSQPTVDHYQPKDKAPHLAYDWDNYRLCNPKMNSYKDNHEDVIDPFVIKNGWFTLNFSTFLIGISDEIKDVALINKIDLTITRLRLNDDDRLVQARANTVRDYAKGDFTFDYLKRKYPFIAFELERQNMQETVKAMIK